MRKLILVLSVIVILGIGGNVAFWVLYQSIKIQESFQTGKEEGYQNGLRVGALGGYQIGNTSGYQIGISEGNRSGYLNGYTIGNLSGYAVGNLTGYTSGFDKGYLQGVRDGAGRGYNIRDPTYQEALNFIALDQTDKNEYSDNYTCFNFASDVMNHAFFHGYRCGFVYIVFPQSAHSIVCFNSTDKGIFFIEPQDDRVTNLKVGQPYWDRAFYQPTYNDTVVSYTIVW